MLPSLKAFFFLAYKHRVTFFFAAAYVLSMYTFVEAVDPFGDQSPLIVTAKHRRKRVKADSCVRITYLGSCYRRVTPNWRVFSEAVGEITQTGPSWNISHTVFYTDDDNISVNVQVSGDLVALLVLLRHGFRTTVAIVRRSEGDGVPILRSTESIMAEAEWAVRHIPKTADKRERAQAQEGALLT